ncbi:MAG: alpha-hydroxy acid oxidase [Gemmatimonadota bacterium]
MTERPDELLNLYDFERAARERLPAMAYDYYASGAMDELTLRENHAAYDRLRLRYRVLRNVSQRDLSTVVLGHRLALPVLVAPTAFQKLADPDGEAATARAAAAAGTVMMLSTISTTAMEEVAAGGNVWFQLYVYRDRGVTEALVRRAEAAGCRAIVLTADAPLLGRRERDVRNRFRLPEGLRVENLLPAGLEDISEDELDSGLAAYVAEAFDPSLCWRDVEWLCGVTRLPVLVKGVVHPEDARLAAEHGAAGVVVSNHGGRQLDTAPPTIEVLPEVAEAVADLRSSGHSGAGGARGGRASASGRAADPGAGTGGRFAVLVDGGVRRGTDVVKAIALGADAVAVGRPALWGLAVGGEAGVRRVLEILREEVDLALALCGCSSLEEVRSAGGDLVRLP